MSIKNWRSKHRDYHLAYKIRKTPDPDRTFLRASQLVDRFEKKWNHDPKRVSEMSRNLLIIIRGKKASVLMGERRNEFERSIAWFQHFLHELENTRNAIRAHINAERAIQRKVSKSDRLLLDDYNDRVNRWKTFVSHAKQVLIQGKIKD